MTPLIAIETNSKRLYDEAVAALGVGNFSTSIALAIFSFEEAAKFAIVKRESYRPELPRKRITRHHVKHEEIGEIIWYWAIYSVLSETAENFKFFTAQLPNVNTQTMEFIEALSGGEAVNFLRYNMFQTEGEMRVYVKERFGHPELLEIVEAGRSGAIETIRRKALYVDLTDDRTEIVTTPIDFTHDDAVEWLKIAWFGQEYIALSKRIWNSA